MKILVSDIPDVGLDIEDVEVLTAEAEGVDSEAVLRLRLERVDSTVRVRGGITARVSYTCGRCLKEIAEDVTIPVDMEFHPVDELRGEERYELRADEMDTGFYVNNEIDLRDVSKEHVLLHVPMKPLCSEDCRGICPKCGINLNENSCDCAVASSRLSSGTDFRFEKLREYMKGRDKNG